MDTTTQTPTDLITLTEAARLLPGTRAGKSRHVATIYRWREQGRLRSWRIGGRHYCSRSELLALVQPVLPRRPRLGAEGVELTRSQIEAETAAVLRRHGLE